LTPSAKNVESYKSLQWVFDNAEKGFYILTATPDMQRRVASYYDAPGIAIYDYSVNNAPYSYGNLAQWADNIDAKIRFVLNMQIALRDKNDMMNLNLSRDFLSDIKCIWVFGMTPDVEEFLSRAAMDFYSFVRIQVHFENEIESINDISSGAFQPRFMKSGDIRTGDYYGTYEEAVQQMQRYDDLRDELMNLPMDAAPERLLASAMTLENIADLYDKYGRYDDALNLLEYIKPIREKLLGEEHADTAAIYHKIGLVYFLKSEYDKSLIWYQKALAIREKVLGDNHPATAVTYNDIALVYSRQKKYNKALNLYQKALVITEKSFGEEHRETAIVYFNIAQVYDYQGDYVKALDWFFKSLKIKENVLGTDHPSTAKTYHDIGCCYANQGDYIKALDWLFKSLKISEKVLGVEHRNTATTYWIIAWVYKLQSDYLKVLEWYEKAYPVYYKVFGKDHPNTIYINNVILGLRSQLNEL